MKRKPRYKEISKMTDELFYSEKGVTFQVGLDGLLEIYYEDDREQSLVLNLQLEEARELVEHLHNMYFGKDKGK